MQKRKRHKNRNQTNWTSTHPNNVTLFTDAGLRFGVLGVWGMYARGAFADKTRITCSGKLKMLPEDPTVAEMMAICNALHVVSNQFTAGRIHLLVIYTDSLDSIRMIEKNKSYHVKYRTPLTLYRKLIKKLNPEFVSIRKVKAHTDGSTTQTFLNNLVDDLCRKAYNKP